MGKLIAATVMSAFAFAGVLLQSTQGVSHQALLAILTALLGVVTTLVGLAWRDIRERQKEGREERREINQRLDEHTEKLAVVIDRLERDDNKGRRR